MSEAARDDILYGKLKLWQPSDGGPKVSMDTVLLASWVRVRARRPRFVELGAAAGAVSLMLALRFPPPFTVVGVEIQPDLVALAEKNLAGSGLEGRVSFLQGDLRDSTLLPRESFDGLVMNPPYGAPERAGEEAVGRASPLTARSIARQGLCSLEDIAEAAARLLKGRGRFFAVFSTRRMTAFLRVLAARRLQPKRLRLVHPRGEQPSNLFLIECVKGGGEGLTVEPPLIVLGEDGRYTPSLLRAYVVQ